MSGNVLFLLSLLKTNLFEIDFYVSLLESERLKLIYYPFLHSYMYIHPFVRN